MNHLALITNDMDRTVRFWHGVLGAELVATIATPTFRHYFFSIGPGSTVAFFEYFEGPVASVAKPAGEFHPAAGHFDHLSLNVADEASLLAMRDRLEAMGTEVTDEVDHGFLRSIYFTDPNGIPLEASYWECDPTAPSDNDLFLDEDPVPAVREIFDGKLVSVPQTVLVDAATDNYVIGDCVAPPRDATAESH